MSFHQPAHYDQSEVYRSDTSFPNVSRDSRTYPATAFQPRLQTPGMQVQRFAPSGSGEMKKPGTCSKCGSASAGSAPCPKCAKAEASNDKGSQAPASQASASDPRSVLNQLGEGQSLESPVRSRMESAFGMDFSNVRTHTDSTASGLSSQFSARAFTVGNHIAFKSGEYQPGSMTGDALLAHELAHVKQQQGASTTAATVAPMETGSTSAAPLEADADRSAAGALSRLWGNTTGALGNLAQNAMPRLRSGLRLQRCSDTPKNTAPTISGVCDNETCLKRSGCDSATCKAEAATIKDTYTKRVSAIKRPDMPNRGDIHWGWMCYQWAGLLMREFQKLSLKCWQINWVGIVGKKGTGALLHNYVYTSLGSPKSSSGPVKDCGVILDPWRTGNPVVYDGSWSWHNWNYIHNASDNKGKTFVNGKWKDVEYPPPWTPDESEVKKP